MGLPIAAGCQIRASFYVDCRIFFLKRFRNLGKPEAPGFLRRELMRASPDDDVAAIGGSIGTGGVFVLPLAQEC